MFKKAIIPIIAEFGLLFSQAHSEEPQPIWVKSSIDQFFTAFSIANNLSNIRFMAQEANNEEIVAQADEAFLKLMGTDDWNILID